MDGMSMSSMGANMFQTTNMGIARTFWYMIVGVLGLLLAVRVGNMFDRRQRLRKCISSRQTYPTKVDGRIAQIWATSAAIGREMSYPQLYIPSRYVSWMTPPPLGRVITLFVYWAVIIGMMTSGAIVKDANFWERIGFRNAWTTIMQLPLLYLLASKSSVLGMIVGTSYERLNWLHRWVARTMFVTASVHGWHFWTEWQNADITDEMMAMMTMVKWGIAAWGLLLWTIVSGFAPFRHMWYELFVAQHIFVGFLFLWVVYTHVPSYAQYNVWFAIAALCFDRFYRGVLLLWQNIKVNPNRSRCKGGQRIGHAAQIRAVGDDTTIVTIKDVHFSWRAGQHLYLWMPQIDATGHHPYTIASAHSLPGTCICNSIQLVVRKHKGFSKKLYDRAAKLQAAQTKQTFTVFATGPYGAPPRWDVYETLVLISASTGASFNLPILESVILSKKAICTRRIDFLLAAKSGDEIDYYVHQLHELMVKANDAGIELNVHVAVTQRSSRPMLASEPTADEKGCCCCSAKKSQEADGAASGPMAIDETGNVSGNATTSAADIEKLAAITSITTRSSPRTSIASSDSKIQYMSSRPDIDEFLRLPVEATGGETSVVVCGGKSLVARVRNSVARLSDERAVHKGSGAQGIHLHVEEYCF